MAGETREAGALYLVGTPIGNLEDMTLRGIRTLQEADAIAAEDTRRTGKLLQHFQIATPQISYHQHNRVSRRQELLERLERGEKIALVADAGMPGISDPGQDLVAACIAAGIAVIPIPGPTAAITALIGSGLSTDRFAFEGFLPLKARERQERLEALKPETRTLIFYEAPHRLQQTLQDLAESLGGDRPLVLARELTKFHEEWWRGTLNQALGRPWGERQPKGEFTLVVAGSQAPPLPKPSEAELKAKLRELFRQGINRSQASRQLAQSTSLPRRQLYELALTTSLEGDRD